MILSTQQHRAAMAVYKEICSFYRLRKAAGGVYSPTIANISKMQLERIKAMKMILIICGVFYDREHLEAAIEHCRHERKMINKIWKGE